MKLITATILAVTLATSSQASDTNTLMQAYCDSLASMAESIMNAHQSGVTFGEGFGYQGGLKVRHAHDLRDIAVQSPIATDQGVKAEIVSDFGAAVFDRCIYTNGRM